jgi:hypothetical protein
MSHLDALPERVRALLRSRPTGEFATVSKAGVPIDTPTYVFPQLDLSIFAIATGLAYPAKAERARRDPRVGLTIEGDDDDPVVSIAGRAAVRDADLQANLDRYLRETILLPEISPDTKDWNRIREATYYLTRVIVEVTPARIRWWPNRAAMDRTPAEWSASSAIDFPISDPAPSGNASPAPAWPERPWRHLADRAMARGCPAHLTLCDQDGYPLPFRARRVERTEAGFRLLMPAAVPWRAGPATLSFLGWEIFVGEVAVEAGRHVLNVERALPILPLIENATAVEEPDGEIHRQLMERLRHEAHRRGQPVPTAPETPPLPSDIALLRAGRGPV